MEEQKTDDIELISIDEDELKETSTSFFTDYLVLSTSEWEKLQVIHEVCPIPALTLGVLKPIITDDEDVLYARDLHEANLSKNKNVDGEDDVHVHSLTSSKSSVNTTTWEEEGNEIYRNPKNDTSTHMQKEETHMCIVNDSSTLIKGSGKELAHGKQRRTRRSDLPTQTVSSTSGKPKKTKASSKSALDEARAAAVSATKAVKMGKKEKICASTPGDITTPSRWKISRTPTPPASRSSSSGSIRARPPSQSPSSGSAGLVRPLSHRSSTDSIVIDNLNMESLGSSLSIPLPYPSIPSGTHTFQPTPPVRKEGVITTSADTAKRKNNSHIRRSPKTVVPAIGFST